MAALIKHCLFFATFSISFHILLSLSPKALAVIGRHDTIPHTSFISCQSFQSLQTRLVTSKSRLCIYFFVMYRIQLILFS